MGRSLENLTNLTGLRIMTKKKNRGSMQRIISKWFLFEKSQTNTGNMLIIMISVFRFHLCLRFVSYFFASSVFTFYSQSQSCIILIEHFPPFITADTSKIVSEISMYISSPFFFSFSSSSLVSLAPFASRFWFGFLPFLDWSSTNRVYSSNLTSQSTLGYNFPFASLAIDCISLL